MAQHWKEILPIDRYTAASNGMLHEYDRKIITLLYQPLIGSVSMSLYMTLWAQVEENRIWSQEDSHHRLMGLMDLNLKVIYEARLKLEGIGLLKTYVKKNEETRSFIYELQPPLQPDQFFLDGLLNIYLYQKVGKNQFLKLKQFFSDKKINENREYDNVTRAFQDVYQSAVPSSIQADAALEAEQGLERMTVGRGSQEGVQIGEHPGFDFDLFMAGLSESLVPKKAITAKVKAAINNLSYLYGIDAIQMKNLVITAINDMENKVDLEELRKAARDWYQFEHQDKLPLLVDKVQPIHKKTVLNEPKTKEEKLVHYLDTTSPRQLLIDISGGTEPSKADLQIVEEVMFKQKLHPGVVNVLIQYVLLKTDMKLTKGYVDKIASHWARKKISTVREAMDLAIKEHRQYLEWAENKNTPKSPAKKKPIRTEAIPDWFDEQEKTTFSKHEEENLEDKKKALEERLKKFKS